MSLVLVTGATGRMGSSVVSALLARGDSVRAVVRPESRGSLPAGVERISHDLSSGPLPAEAFEGVQSVAHLAGLVGSHPYGQLLAHNAFAVRNLLSHCPSSVGKIVMASSISVYGDYPGQLVDESFALNPKTGYGKSKKMGEVFARDYCDTLPIALLRIGMVYGPAFTQGYYDVFRYLEKGKMRIMGDGENRIPLVHISDVVSAILLALDRPVPHCREYNIVGAEQMAQKELLSTAAKELGVPAPTKHASPLAAMLLAALSSALGKKSLDPDNVRQLSSDRAYSCKRAHDELGWEPKVRLADGIAEMVRLYKSRKQVE